LASRIQRLEVCSGRAGRVAAGIRGVRRVRRKRRRWGRRAIFALLWLMAELGDDV
jgi:hypothetical protein